MNKLPKAKADNIVVQDLKGELLVYNLTNHQAFTLNETLKIVFNACNGTTTFEDLKHQYNFSDDLIYLALDELNKNNLIAESYQSKFAGVSRREVIRRVGLASMMALPVIAGLVAPSASQAASVTCTPGNDASDAGNGFLGNGGSCTCAISGNQFPACNTTRGGGGNSGCKRGCLCRANPQTQCVPDGSACAGICG